MDARWKIGAIALTSFLSGFAKNHALTMIAATSACDGSLLKADEQPWTHDLFVGSLAGPLIEEVTYREVLQQAVGLPMASIIFGLAHGGGHDESLKRSTFLKADAAIGGLLYGIAFNLGGLGASTACHSLHNLGASLGHRMAVKTERARRNGTTLTRA